MAESPCPGTKGSFLLPPSALLPFAPLSYFASSIYLSYKAQVTRLLENQDSPLNYLFVLQVDCNS